MTKLYRIELDTLDLGQVLDGLKLRAEAWERTASFLRTGAMPAGEVFLVEECSKPEEAEGIAAHYRGIIGRIQAQMEAQS